MRRDVTKSRNATPFFRRPSRLHGTIFAELKKYVDAKFGGATWNQLLQSAGLGPKMYLPVQAYPDEDVAKIVGAASTATGIEPSAILQDFGQFIAPDLVAMYRSLMKPEWKTLEVIENAETTAHRVVRRDYIAAAPPYLHAVRSGPEQVTVTYNSARRLCDVAKGIVGGLARHYKEKVSITETRCMHRGAAECVLVVDRSR